MNKLSAFLWFDNQAEEAADFYCSVFKDAKKGAVARFPEGTAGRAGSVMTADFELMGMSFVALNGGPHFRFSEAVSFQIHCKDQAEVDYYWDRLTEGGEPSQCGWLKDKFGLSWQVTPKALTRLASSSDKAKAGRVMAAMMKQRKIIIAELEAAAREPASP
ncbi:MAG TPA: VOC family protein [Caulobacteraceae bacterium]|nr:VOC family protein [Caulobacteraceae bacterium]